MSKVLRYGVNLFLWALTYYVVGVASLEFDNPQSQMAVIWFPAGVSVSAFLSSRRSRWPMLFLALVIAKVLLDTHGDHGVLGVTLTSGFELSGALVIAWLVRRITRRGDDLHGVLVWVSTTVFICAVWVLLEKGGAALLEGAIFSKNSFLTTWISLINGIFFTTAIVMGLINNKLPKPVYTSRTVLLGGCWFLFLGLNTWYIFSGPPHWLESIIHTGIGAAIYFILTCLPVVITIIVSLIWGSRGGSLALLMLGVIVVSYTDQQKGPFYLADLLEGEPLLLAQSFLTIIALLVVSIRVTTQTSNLYDVETGRLPGEGVAYQLHLESGQIIWDDNLEALLGISVQTLGSLQQVMQRVHPKDHQKLEEHWSANKSPGCHGSSLALRLRKDNGEWLTIHDQSPGVLLNADGRIIVGDWQISHYS